MKILRAVLAATALTALAAGPAFADAHSTNPTVGGAAMMAEKTIVENASAAPNLSTLVAAVQAAGLVETLSSDGPFTVFAPVNEAFAALPDGTVDTLLQPENKDQLTKVLTYHVVSGKVTAEAVIDLVNKSGGRANVQTVSGDTITLGLQGNHVIIFDESGRAATVTTADVMQSNGVVHVINKVLLPK